MNPTTIITFLCGSLFVLCTLLNSSEAYKFLGVLPTAARSHYIVGSALFKELALRGHEVTLISPFPLKKPMANFRDIPTPSAFKAMEGAMNTLLDTHERSIVENIINFHNMGVEISKNILEEPEVRALLRSNETFDAVICEVFLSESIFGLAEHFQVPLIGLGTFGAISWNTDLVGSPSPPSYVPAAMLRFTDHMSLVERIGNLAFLTFERCLLNFYYLPKQAELYKKNFPNAKRDMYEVRKNTALVLLNTHVSLSFSRPYVANQIEVGGMQINRKTSPLPEHLKKFIEEAKDGVIYFSMGSNIKGKDLPIEKRQAFLETFRDIKQRVLWKFELPNLPGKPDNVLISDWFPQDDILAHPNVKLFVTHGGLLSTTESIYHGKPFIGIPIFGDQFLNMARAETNGYGIMLDYGHISKESFTEAIQRMLANPSYTKLVAAMSARFRDQPMQPLDLAVYWVEHVARHQGAKYLHCTGQDLNFMQYHNIDAMLILYGGIVFVLFLILSLLRCLLSLCFGKKQIKQSKKVKKN